MLAVLATSAQATSALVVHEWGTFTSFQDSLGQTLGGINVDDEPVPTFVHRLKELPIHTPATLPATWSQGAPRCHPDITLRLETPVVYFHPPGGAWDGPVDFEASFRGGWLTEYYPAARANHPGFPGRLSDTASGRLRWEGLRLGPGKTAGPRTREKVWLAPRQAEAARVTAAGGKESEQFLFYRGVAHREAPLSVTTLPAPPASAARDGRVVAALRNGPSRLETLPPAWLVRVFPDGAIAHSTLDAAGGADLPLRQGAGDGLALRAILKDSLIARGLFADEAQAMLDTWELSYFRSEGLRLFFLLPGNWIDRELPIKVSVPAQITRVMMGRIELISPFQKSVLARIPGLEAAELGGLPLYVALADADAKSPRGAGTNLLQRYSVLHKQGRTHAELYAAFSREAPRALTLYDSLGRFRDALLAHRMELEKDSVQRRKWGEFRNRFSACVDWGRF